MLRFDDVEVHSQHRILFCKHRENTVDEPAVCCAVFSCSVMTDFATP